MSLLAKLRFYPQSLALRWRIASARRLFSGRFRWHAMDALGLPGFGTDLLRVDFPPDAAINPRWGHGKPPHPELARLLDAGAASQEQLLAACLAHTTGWSAWPEAEDPALPELPWRQNMFLTPSDQILLFGALQELRPRRYLEVGSGMSTRIAWQARRAGAFPMDIVSIDPEPRLAIASLCDEVHRRRLEDAVDTFLGLVTPETVVFFDGSHRSFPGSDVTLFFLEILPRLPAGTVVHIHDIYLPDDYAPRVFGRLWSEQYLLAAWLLGGGNGLSVLLPGARLAQRPATRNLLAAALGSPDVTGSSFWLRKT